MSLMAWACVMCVGATATEASATVDGVLLGETRLGMSVAATPAGGQSGFHLTHRSWAGLAFGMRNEGGPESEQAIRVGSSYMRQLMKVGVGLELDADLHGSMSMSGTTAAWAQGEAKVLVDLPVFQLAPLASWQRHTSVDERQWRSWREQAGVGFEVRMDMGDLVALDAPLHVSLGRNTFRLMQRRTVSDGAFLGIDFENDFDGFSITHEEGADVEIWKVGTISFAGSYLEGAGVERAGLMDIRLRALEFDGWRILGLSFGGDVGIDYLNTWGDERDIEKAPRQSGKDDFAWRLSIGRHTHVARDPLDPRGDYIGGPAWQVSVGTARRLDATGERVDEGLKAQARLAWRPQDDLGVWALGFSERGEAVMRADGGELGEVSLRLGVHGGAGWQFAPGWMLRGMARVERSDRDDFLLGLPDVNRWRWGGRMILERGW